MEIILEKNIVFEVIAEIFIFWNGHWSEIAACCLRQI